MPGEIWKKLLSLADDEVVLQMVFNNRFLLILLVIILMRAKYATYGSLWLTALVNVPGTLLHELMHYFVGGILNAQPTRFTILPKKGMEGGYVMGSVGFRNIRFYNAVPAAMAPLLLLFIGFYINRHMLPQMHPSLSNYILYVLLQTVIIENAIPSRADFKVAGKYFSGLVLYAVFFGSVLLCL